MKLKNFMRFLIAFILFLIWTFKLYDSWSQQYNNTKHDDDSKPNKIDQTS